ncbi:ABC transporter substrate-binding protein [Parasulfitobacter algicola]|uniref:ABC transporter substrate-binding protein n=1 Tax=Parasulfitobacter algicola TaxID=2614809 RepID=A0ABX2ITH7_9RHOB|nr:ABC transporter substrate-binding protein [Sulfitobacter algicola]NSX56232.1 ABC transporter substrate-binding protein [Sulfitobacter algicola]
MRLIWAVLAVWAIFGFAHADVRLDMTYLLVEQPQPPTLSGLDPLPDTLGIDGAHAGLQDNITTGRFLGHNYGLDVVRVPVGGDAVAAAQAVLGTTQIVVMDAPADILLQIADLPDARGAVLLNVAAEDVALRAENCRANILHTVPSVAMRTDALAQFFVKKRWDDLVMIVGEHPGDVAYADAMLRSLQKFGLKLSGQKTWAFDADMRRNAAQEVPLFTQDFGDYNALIVADELGDFGRYIIYNTWQARPVVGSEGLTAVTWSPVVEQWGAAQLQSRFTDEFRRSMAQKDYAAWAAVRAVGEAVTRTNSNDPATLRSYMLSDQFELAGFKGRPLTFRTWNGQLRQPIPLVHPRALVAQAPLEGFLHQRTELDTLGLDQPESNCTEFAQ